MLTPKERQRLIGEYVKTAPDNVLTVGYGYKVKDGVKTNELSIIVTVPEKKPINEIPENELIPKSFSINNKIIRSDVVVGSQPFFLQQCPASHYSFFNTVPINAYPSRPLMGGVSMTNYTSKGNSTGTLGLIAIDNDTNSLVGVSNNHVLIDDAFYGSLRPHANGITNVYLDVVNQPNELSGFYPTAIPGGPSININGPQYAIGIVKKYVPIITKDLGSNVVDCAATTLNEVDIDYNTSFLQKGLSYSQPMDFATTSEIDDLLLTNPFLFSAGRTTGPKGELDMKLLVYETDVTILNIAYKKQGVNVNISFDRSISFVASATTVPVQNPPLVCYWPSGPGDSGSVVSADFGGIRKIIGLLYAGSTGDSGEPIVGYLCRIDDIAQELNISPWTGQTVNFSSTGTTEFYCIPTNGGDKNIVVTGNTFWQLGLC